MNEEQAVLEFFARKENLPLALIAAEHLDAIRRDLNNEFWQVMRSELESLVSAHSLPWTVKITEDRNSQDCLVGLCLEPSRPSRVFLRPFMEQQYMGEGYRVYHGLMWSATPDAGQQGLPAVGALAATLAQAGFKQGDNFFGYQWMPWHPRRRDFLMKFGMHREQFLPEMMQPWQQLLLRSGGQLQAANRELGDAGPTTTISLDQLRGKLPSRNA